MKQRIFTYTILVITSVPFLAFAEGDVPGIGNPLKVDSVEKLIFSVVDIATTIGFYIAVFFIIYVGFKFVTARGDISKLKDARNAFLWTVVGTAVLLGARVISEVIQGTIDQIKAEAPQQHDIFHV